VAEAPVTVGGQAVLEGVMMRAPAAWAVAVRRPDGRIEATRQPLPRLSSRSRLARLPLIRGVLVLGESLTLGFKALSWSAQKAVGEDEKPLSKGQVAGSMTLALLLFAGLFIVGPAALARFLTAGSAFLFNLAEGVIRLGLFLAYLWLLGRSSDIRRVFQYHGAEHMAIHAFEGGVDLSVGSVARYRPEHPRCGTSFLLIVVVGSIILFSLLGRPEWPLLVASRLLGIPVIAGISYEVLKFSGTRTDRRLGRVLVAPGLWLQRLTTRVPDLTQIEVAVASLLSALEEHQVAEVSARGPLPEAAQAARAR
jgi:uncharacterized protein YqhQ